MNPSKFATRAGNFLKWIGFSSILFGVCGSAYTAFIFVRAETGFALGSGEQCCSQLGIMALGAVLGSMFFVLIGSILLLLSRLFEQTRPRETKRVPAWLRWIPPGLYLYGICIFALTAVLASNADQLGDAAGGIVTFCVFSFLGLILVASGIRRTRELEAQRRPPLAR